MTAVAVNPCVICGAPEPFGLSVCPVCGGSAHAAGDTLIFVRPEGTGDDLRTVAGALEPLLAGRAHKSERDLVSRGHRALIRVPVAMADAVVRQLALHGIPALARPARRAWTSVPAPMGLLLLAILVTGGLAGAGVEPLLAWTSPAVAMLLFIATQLRLRQPAIGTPNRRPAFPGDIEKRIAETFAELPSGEARSYLASLVRAAEPVRRALADQPGIVEPEEIDALLAHSCRAATGLSDLDTGITARASQPGLERVTRLRYGIAQRFQQAVSVLHRLRVATIENDPARQELSALLEALDEEADAYSAARDELKSLL